MKRMYITGMALLTMAVLPTTSMAQDKVETNIGADLVSGYIWRGQDLGNVSINLQFPYPTKVSLFQDGVL